MTSLIDKYNNIVREQIKCPNCREDSLLDKWNKVKQEYFDFNDNITLMNKSFPSPASKYFICPKCNVLILFGKIIKANKVFWRL